MKIAIHHRPGSFSDNWIAYCKRKNIPYKIVNSFDTDIISRVRDCDAFMWHHYQGNFKEVLVARKILFAVEHAGKAVFPDFKTDWHFDDKVAQKYLLEAVDAPLVPSYVFYDKQEALSWVEGTTFPKVWKLRGGAGSSNVQLVKTKGAARRKIKKAFRRGSSHFNRWNYLNSRYKKYRSGTDTLLGVMKGIVRLFIPTKLSKQLGREKGYAYFQEFMPNNNFDIRVVVVGNKAVAEKRFVRKDDFRASGSGDFDYSGINIDVIDLAFKTIKRLKMQCIAFDFIFDRANEPLIVEMSYCFGIKGILNAPGYWDEDLNWHGGKSNPQEWMIEDFLNSIKNNKIK